MVTILMRWLGLARLAEPVLDLDTPADVECQVAQGSRHVHDSQQTHRRPLWILHVEAMTGQKVRDCEHEMTFTALLRLLVAGGLYVLSGCNGRGGRSFLQVPTQCTAVCTRVNPDEHVRSRGDLAQIF